MDSNKRPRNDKPKNEEELSKRSCLINDGLPALQCTTCCGLVTNGYTHSGRYVTVSEHPCSCRRAS